MMLAGADHAACSTSAKTCEISRLNNNRLVDRKVLTPQSVQLYRRVSSGQLPINFFTLFTFRWRSGVVVGGVGLINEVNRHRARLVLGWVTVCGRVNHLGM